MSDFDSLIQRYIAAWNEIDATARRHSVEQVWAPDARYIDPLVVAQGHDAIDATIRAVHGQFPGLAMRLVGSVDAHHDQARFTWALGPPDGEPLVIGFDVVERDRNGQLALVLGFLDKVPTAA